MRFNLRFENNLNSIASLMREMQVHKTSLTLWQNQSGNRILSQAFIKNLDSNHNVITLNPFKKNFLSFKSDDLIFCHTEFKSIVFKTSIKTLDANLLNCSIPESLRLLELRTEPRVNFGLEFNPPEIMTENNDVFRLFDLSPKGACFIIPRSLLGKFFIDDRLHLMPMAMQEVEQFHEAKIKHISPYYQGPRNTHQYFRIGVQFKVPVQVQDFMGSIKNQAS
jgi:hypothetical protein